MVFSLQEMPLPLRFRPETPMSDDHLLRLSTANECLRFERDPNGEIFVTSPAGLMTGMKNTYLIRALADWAEIDGRGYAFDSNTGFNLANGSMRSPDTAWVRADRFDSLSEEEKDRFAPICPDFVIELRSPTDRLPDLQAKMEEWIANGAQLAWLIDSQLKSVTIYRPNHPPQLLDQPASIHGETPVAGFELPLDRIWA